MGKPGRKLFIDDSLAQDHLNGTKLWKMKQSFLAGAKVNMACHQAGQAGHDTLPALQDVYMAFRTERQHDQLCGYVVACIVPGTTPYSPIITIWIRHGGPLRALENKHMVPTIGLIHTNQAELVHRVYTREGGGLASHARPSLGVHVPGGP